MARFAKQRAVARRDAAKGMAGGILRQIRLGLDDPACGDAAWKFAHQHFAQQKASKRFCVGRHKNV